jgi:PleD family two-component response regulator
MYSINVRSGQELDGTTRRAEILGPRHSMTSNHVAPIRVLIVEDDAVFRHNLIATVQGSSDFEIVASCCSAQDALSAINNAPIDVALVDLGLPDGSGTEVLEPSYPLSPDATSRSSEAPTGPSGHRRCPIRHEARWDLPAGY